MFGSLLYVYKHRNKQRHQHCSFGRILRVVIIKPTATTMRPFPRGQRLPLKPITIKVSANFWENKIMMYKHDEKNNNRLLPTIQLISWKMLSPYRLEPNASTTTTTRTILMEHGSFPNYKRQESLPTRRRFKINH